MSNKPEDSKTPQIDKDKKAAELTDQDLDKVAGGTRKPPLTTIMPKPKAPK